MITMRARVNRIRSRSSGIFQVFANAEIIKAVGEGKCRVGYTDGEEALEKHFLAGKTGVIDPGGIRSSGRFGSGGRLDGATGLFDLFAGGSAGISDHEGQRLFDFAIAENLDLIAAAVEKAD